MFMLMLSQYKFFKSHNLYSFFIYNQDYIKEYLRTMLYEQMDHEK